MFKGGEEEVGLKLKNLKLAGCVYVKDKRFDDESVQFYFNSGTLTQKQIKAIKINNDEIVDYKFADPKTLSRYSQGLYKRIEAFLKSKATGLPFYFEENL